MFLSSKYKFIFIHIPRTGGTSLEYSLATISKDDKIIFELIKLLQPDANRMLVSNKFNQIKHYNQADIKNILDQLTINYSDWFEFTLVRNPYDRFLSIYENYAKQTTTNQYLYGFDEFLSIVSHAKQDNDFFKEQLYWINHPLTGKINVLRYEKLEEEFINLCDRLGIDRYPLKHIQKSEYRNRITLTEAQKEKIYDLYRCDFIGLGYDK